jgi:hypothetical protein
MSRVSKKLLLISLCGIAAWLVIFHALRIYYNNAAEKVAQAWLAKAQQEVPLGSTRERITEWLRSNGAKSVLVSEEVTRNGQTIEEKTVIGCQEFEAGWGFKDFVSVWLVFHFNSDWGLESISIKYQPFYCQ